MIFSIITKFLSRRKSDKNFTCNVAGLKIKSSLKVLKPLFLGFILLLFNNGYLFPATPAGTIISNMATASFMLDTNSNVTNFISSAPISNTVIPYAPILKFTHSTNSMAGQTVTFGHAISNSGNATNKLRIKTTNTSGYPLTVYLDTNNNFIRDAGEPSITNITVPPKQKVSILITETIPGVIPSIINDTITISGISLFSNNNVRYDTLNVTDTLTISPLGNGIIYIFATDGIHNASKLDGSENLGDKDVTVYIKLIYPPVSGKVDMYFDANRSPDGSLTGNTSDTKIQMSQQGEQWVAVIPGNDPRIINKADIRIAFEDNGSLLTHNVTSASIFDYIVRTYQYKEHGNLLNSILYASDSSKPKPTILVNLERSARLKISIFDIKGEKVRILADEQRNAGIQNPIIWDGKNDSGQTVGVGLYFITLQYDKVKEVFKVIVIK